MKELKIHLPDSVRSIIDTLKENGFDAYAVGGCVRDSLLGTLPHDWDICTDAFPDAVMRIFAHTVPTGIKHGTVTVIDERDTYEVTTYRTDGKYTDSRRPDSVTFTRSLEEDLARRDFTINSMAYNPYVGLVDIFGGRADLKNGTIRCVGVPDKRFSEDALRVLRAWRFACQLGFEIEKHTLAAAKHHAADLNIISSERVRDEFVKALKNTDGFVRAELGAYSFLGYIIPEWRAMNSPHNNPHHIYTIAEHSLRALLSLPREADLTTKLAVLLHDIGKPQCRSTDENGIDHFYGHAKASAEIADSIMSRLRFDTRTRKNVVELVGFHDAFVDDTQKSVKRWLNKIGEEQLRRLTEIKKTDTSAQNPIFTTERLEKAERIVDVLESVLEENACFSMKELAVGGRELISEAGYTAGPQLGAALTVLLDSVIAGDVQNNKDALIKMAKELRCNTRE